MSAFGLSPFFVTLVLPLLDSGFWIIIFKQTLCRGEELGPHRCPSLHLRPQMTSSLYLTSLKVIFVVNTFNPLRGLTQGSPQGEGEEGLRLIIHHGAMLSSVVPP